MKRNKGSKKSVEFLDEGLPTIRGNIGADEPSGGLLKRMRKSDEGRASGSDQDLFEYSDGHKSGSGWSGFSAYKHKARGGFVDSESDGGASPGRLFSYFASGSFTRRKLLRRERVIQRNKAILMLIAVGLVAFWVFYRFSNL